MEIYIWIGFIVFVLVMLALDLGVFNKNPHEISVKEAFAWTAFWITLALVFNVLVYFMYEHHWLGIGKHIGHDLGGYDAALQYFTGYIIEKSLSLDNIFIIALIFSYFDVPPKFQHRTLYWGIIGAIILRGGMIAAGAALINSFSWIVYIFGAFLIFTAVRMLVSRQESIHPEKNPLIRLAKKFYQVSLDFDGQKFFTHVDGKRAITPLFLVLLIIESSDVIFAVDSIPAIFSVTYDPFIVFTSNIFAILGLRSLYFALAGVMPKFRYLKMSLVFLMAYVGAKMLLSHHYPIPTTVSLAIIAVILLVGILASLFSAEKEKSREPVPEASTDEEEKDKPSK